MNIITALLTFFVLVLPVAADQPDAQAILDRSIERLSTSGVLAYSFRHQGPGARALTTGWAKIAMSFGDDRGRFSQARIEGRTRMGGQVQVVIDRPDIYALDVERRTLWHSTPRNGGLGLYNPEHLAPVFLLRALSRARYSDDNAAWVGRQVVGRMPCNVVDYFSQRMQLRVWIGEADDLPRRIEAYNETLFEHGALVITLDDWQINIPVSEGDFKLALPEGYKRAEYKSAEGARWD